MTYLTKLLAGLAVVTILALNGVAATAHVATTAHNHKTATITKKVLGQHLKVFVEGNVAAIMANYAADAVFITQAGVLRGRDQIRPIFEGLVAEFGKPGTSFEMIQQVIDGNLAYIVWKAETADNVYEIGTDTFVVRNGKIVQQTLAAKITPKL
jgi:ketosteroid isomerase-like protein